MHVRMCVYFMLIALPFLTRSDRRRVASGRRRQLTIIIANMRCYVRRDRRMCRRASCRSCWAKRYISCLTVVLLCEQIKSRRISNNSANIQPSNRLHCNIISLFYLLFQFLLILSQQMSECSLCDQVLCANIRCL